MKRSQFTDEQIRDYYRKGVEEFRSLLEREFKRTHPGGYLNNGGVPAPTGYPKKTP